MCGHRDFNPGVYSPAPPHEMLRGTRSMKTSLLLGAALICVVGTPAYRSPEIPTHLATGGGVIGPPGLTASYRVKEDVAAASNVASFTLALGDAEPETGDGRQWISLDASKVSGERFRILLLSKGYPPATLNAARESILRYILQEGSSPPREYRSALTGQAVLPALGGWEFLFPRPAGQNSAAELFPDEMRYLGLTYVRQSLVQASPTIPPAHAKVVLLRPDLLIGQESNLRQKDETRRYDGSDYEYLKLTRDDYREMAQAGINCVQVNWEQTPWADDLGLYYWGGGAVVKFPESLYDSQYLGPTLFLDEPAVGTRDYVLRPRLQRDPAFRRTITPHAAFEAFREHYAEALKGAPFELMRELAARADVKLGDMQFAQENLFSWETMVATADYELSQDPLVPQAFVFEPPGHIGTRRTLPEIDMTYGVQIPPDDPLALTDILFGFLRGAARATDKSWGVSIYGQVQPEDSAFWLTHAYDLGATRFFFWDNAGLAAVPHGEILELARHLRAYAETHPRRDLKTLSRSATKALLLPPGYNLGHVYMGRGPLWGLHELNMERENQQGVKYRTVMSNFFTEVERSIKQGESFDLLWDLPGIELQGYREIVRIREDGKVEVESAGKRQVLDGPRVPPRAPGPAPELSVSITESTSEKRVGMSESTVEVSALAHVVETAAPVYYTVGHARDGIVYNNMGMDELYGPKPEDHQFLTAEKPARDGQGASWDIPLKFKIIQPGNYRLRVSTVDTAGRSTVVWKPIEVSRDASTGKLHLL